MSRKICFIMILFTLLLSFIGCPKKDIFPLDYSFSFENGMEGWERNGTDLGNPPIDWSIERSQDRATDGTNSLKYYLNNLTDAGKIWIVRRFSLESEKVYKIRVEYDFASRDFGQFNLFQLITGVMQRPPVTSDDIVSYVQDDTGNDDGPEYKWLVKEYEFNVRSSANGSLYVFIGIWGTWEGPRTYYIDSISIDFTEQ